MSNILKQTPKDVEGYVLVSPLIAMKEASRCLLCHDAPCSKSCPAGTDPAKFIRSIRFRNVKGAIETIRENNPLGGICARVCPYDKFCEQACSAALSGERPIQIGLLQQFAMQQEKAYGVASYIEPVEKKNKRVACIGAGPSSLAVASELAKNGYDVTVYEREKYAGGMTKYGISQVRLPEEVINQDLEYIQKLGVKFVFSKEVSPKDLNDFDAVFSGFGLWGYETPNIEGAKLENSYSAVEFLTKFRKEDQEFVRNKRVVIIGGGDVAMDCAVTANIYGASDIKIVYRKTIQEAPAQIREIQNVINRGISLTTGFKPLALKGNGKVEAIEFEGFKNPSDKLTISTDIVIFATGQKSELTEYPEFKDHINEKGLLNTTNGHITGKYFAAGDCVHGARTVVEAVKEAKAVSKEMIKFLEK